MEVKAEDKELEIIKIFGLKGKIFLLTMIDENKENFVQFNLSILDKEEILFRTKKSAKSSLRKRDKPVPLIFSLLILPKSDLWPDLIMMHQK